MMMRSAFFCVHLLYLLVASSAPHPLGQDDVGVIIQRSVEANAGDWGAAPNYDYFERDRQANGGTKTSEELIVFGSPYERLIAINGKPLPPEQEAREQQKLESATAERRNESEKERTGRIAAYNKDRSRDHLMMEQLTQAFDFTLLGEQKLDGRSVYVLKATPRSGYKPPNMETEVLPGMQGKLWIDKETFQWVKVEAQVVQPVSIEGFLAQVQRGTRFELEKMPVAEAIWLPKHFSMNSRAKVLFLFTRKQQADETYYGYHKFNASHNEVSGN